MSIFVSSLGFQTMLTVKSDSSQISMLIYEMYHRAENRYPDAIVQKRFHVIYLKMTNPKLSCTQIGSYVEYKSYFLYFCKGKENTTFVALPKIVLSI